MLTILYHGAVLFEHLVKQSKIKIKNSSLYHYEHFFLVDSFDVAHHVGVLAELIPAIAARRVSLLFNNL